MLTPSINISLAVVQSLLFSIVDSLCLSVGEQDLSALGRNLQHTIIIDNSPSSYVFHPQNALPCSSWFDDPHDRELLDFIPVLKQLARTDDVRVSLEAIQTEVITTHAHKPTSRQLVA